MGYTRCLAIIKWKVLIFQVYPAAQITKQDLQAELLAARLQRGDEITHVDGRPVEQILAEDLYPYIAASIFAAMVAEAPTSATPC